MQAWNPSARPSADPAHTSTYPETGNLLSPKEANYHLLFFLKKLDSLLYFHTQVLMPSPTSVWKLSFPLIRWSPKNIFLIALGLKFYSFSASCLYSFNYFSWQTFTFPYQPLHIPLNTLKYGLVYAEQKTITLNLSSVFLWYQPGLSIVFRGAYYRIYAQDKHLWCPSHLCLSWYMDSLFLLSSLSYNGHTTNYTHLEYHLISLDLFTHPWNHQDREQIQHHGDSLCCALTSPMLLSSSTSLPAPQQLLICFLPWFP